MDSVSCWGHSSTHICHSHNTHIHTIRLINSHKKTKQTQKHLNLVSSFLQYSQHYTHTHTLKLSTHNAALPSKCLKCPSLSPLSANRNQLVPIVPSPNKRALWEFPLLNTFPFPNRHPIRRLKDKETEDKWVPGGVGMRRWRVRCDTECLTWLSHFFKRRQKREKFCKWKLFVFKNRFPKCIQSTLCSTEKWYQTQHKSKLQNFLGMFWIKWHQGVMIHRL